MLERVLTLRPTNVIARLGEASRVPLLNGSDLLRSVAGPAGFLSVPVSVRSAIPGLLRAARDQDAVVGLSCPHPLAERDTPYRFFEAVREAAEELGHPKPFFLQAGPIVVESYQERTLARLEDVLFKYIDAGFCLLSLDASGLSFADGARACAALAQPVLERELTLELASPRDDAGRPDPALLQRFLQALSKGGVEVHLVRLEAEALGADGAAALERVERLAAAASELGAGLTIASGAGLPGSLVADWVGAGVRKVDLAEPFAQIALAALPATLRDELGAAAQRDGALASTLSRSAHRLDGLEAAARERIEALWYSEACELIAQLSGTRSAGRSMQYLAQESGD